jgi:hypothetical protein
MRVNESGRHGLTSRDHLSMRGECPEIANSDDTVSGNRDIRFETGRAGTVKDSSLANYHVAV